MTAAIEHSPARRGTTNTNDRGSAAQRRARKLWLLATFGNGTAAPCAIQVPGICEGTVTYETITVDRYPIPGEAGGRYRRGNIRPACGPCNASDGSTRMHRRKISTGVLVRRGTGRTVYEVVRVDPETKTADLVGLRSRARFKAVPVAALTRCDETGKKIR